MNAGHKDTAQKYFEGLISYIGYEKSLEYLDPQILNSLGYESNRKDYDESAFIEEEIPDDIL